MAERCLACLGVLLPSHGSMHPKCSRRLLGATKLPSLEVDLAGLEAMARKGVGKVTLAGVQRKLMVAIEKGRLAIGSGPASFLLKPQIEAYPQFPENEHVCLHLARAVGLETPEFGLLPLKDGTLALLVRRFDRTADGRHLPLEDFCQLAEKTPQEKYDGTAEACVRVVRTYCSDPGVELVKLLRIFLLSWWIGNGDLHLRNLSLLTREPGRHALSPCYDLVSTALVIPDDGLALPLHGRKKRLGPDDWLAFAGHCEIPPEAVDAETRRFLEKESACLELVERSFLSPDRRADLRRLLRERSADLAALRVAARGRATRAVARHGEPRPITKVETGRLAADLRKRFGELGMRIKGTDLDADVTELYRYADKAEPDEGAASAKRWQTLDVVLKAARYARIRRALEEASRGGAAGLERLKGLGGKTPVGQDTQWDRLFELEFALQASGPHWQVDRVASDLVLADAQGAKIGVECRRPRRRESIVPVVQETCAHLRTRGLPGVVAVSLDLLVPGWVRAERTHDASGRIRAQIDGVVEDLHRPIAKLLKEHAPTGGDKPGGVFGVLLCATFVVVGPWNEGSDYVDARFVCLTEPNPSFPQGDRLLRLVADSLEAGDHALHVRP